MTDCNEVLWYVPDETSSEPRQLTPDAIWVWVLLHYLYAEAAGGAG